jgi:anti-sigma factor RsiW
VTLFDGEVKPARQPRTTPAVGVVERDHDAIRDRLSDYLAGSLPDSERAAIDGHLDDCRACRAFKRTLEATIRAVNALPQNSAPAPARQRLLDILDSPAGTERAGHPAE